MKIRKISFLLAAAAAATVLTGCDSMLADSHKKTTQKSYVQWQQAKQGIIYEVAVQEYKVGDYTKCRETLRSALATAEPTPPILILAAKVEMEQNGNLELASEYLKQAITGNTAKSVVDAEPYYLLGVVYQRWQKLEEAEMYYELAAQKKSTEAVYVLAAVEMKIAMGELDDAKDYLSVKMNYFEQSAAMRLALARIALLQNDPAEAANQFREATLLSPDNRVIRWQYASALFDAGRFNDSAKILEVMRREYVEPVKSVNPKTAAVENKASEEDVKGSRVSLLMLLGECYVHLNKPLDARDCFQEVIRTQPENLGAYVSLAKACLVSGDYTVGISAARHVMRNDPRNVDAMIILAATQQKQKKWNEAYNTLLDAAKLAPKDSMILCMQGLSQIQLGKKETAIVILEKAVALNPTDAWAGELLAQVKPPVVRAETPAEPSIVPPSIGDAQPIQAAVPTVATTPTVDMTLQPSTPALPGGFTNAAPAGEEDGQ